MTEKNCQTDDLSWSDFTENLDKFLEVFNATFPTEGDCLETILLALETLGLINCKKCASRNIFRNFGSRTGSCNDCKSLVSLTAGTFFHGMRSARAWLLSMFIIGAGFPISALQLQKQINLAYSSTWLLLKKIQMVLLEHVREDLNLAINLVHTRHFLDNFRKRSIETKARFLPKQEQIDLENDEEKRTEEKTTKDGFSHSADNRDNGTTRSTSKAENHCSNAEGKNSQTQAVIAAGKLSELEQKVFDAISENGKDFQSLSEKLDLPISKLTSILIMLELHGLIENRPGELYTKAVPPAGQGTSAGVLTSHSGRGINNDSTSEQNANSESDVIDFALIEKITLANRFFDRINHGISRKNLQLSTISVLCFVDRLVWSIESVFEKCTKGRPITLLDIRAYVTPLTLQL